jgi:hypothetical protein
MLEMNKEATKLAINFRDMFEKSSKALLLCEQVVMKYPDGTLIWDEFQKKLEELWPETSSPDTEGNQRLLSQENTTPTESASKPCTGEMTAGETTAPSS